MLSEIHIRNIENHKYTIIDESLSTILLKPTWNYLESFIPFFIAPNLITLFGLLSTIISSCIACKFHSTNKILTTFISLFFTIIYINLNAIDGIHARKTKNTSSICELLNYGCDSISTILLTIMFSKLLGINDNVLIWKFVIMSSIGYMIYHYNTYNSVCKFGKYTGPFELILYFSLLSLLNLIFPNITELLVKQLENVIGINLCFLLIYSFFKTFDKNIVKNHTMMTWLIKSLIIYCVFKYFKLTPEININQIFYDGCAISFVTWEILLNLIAKRDSGIITLFVLFTYCIDGFYGMLFSLLLVVSYVKEISSKLNLNIFTQNINVYCCGVYDLCHYGHKKMFKEALNFGTRLIVGVHNDIEVKSYKRTPIMNMEERIREVSTSKYVWKVVPNALLKITEKELDDLNIHIVVCCSDYYNDQDTWYTVPKNRQILKPIPYTPEISTTDLIDRCRRLSELNFNLQYAKN